MTEDLEVKLGIDVEGYLRGIGLVDRANDSLGKSISRMANDASNYIRRAYGIMDRLDISTLAVTESTQRAREAQARYNEAISEFGAGSKQALKANQELREAEEAREKAEQRLHTSQALVIADMVSMAGKLPRTAAALEGLAASAKSAAAGMTTAQIAGGALMVTIGGAAAILAGMAVFKTYEDSAKRGATATEELAMANQHLEEVWRRIDFPGASQLNALVDDTFLDGTISTAAEDYAKALDRVHAAEQAVAAEQAEARLNAQAQALQAAAKAAAELEEHNRALVAGISNGFGGLGIDIAAFSQTFRDDLMRNMGVSEDFIKALHGVVDAEAILKNATGETGKALHAQAHITKKKDETTEDFIGRLKELGFTEEEITKRINASRDALLSQAEATQTVSDATLVASGGSGGSGSSGTRSPSTSGWTIAPSPDNGPSLEEFLANRQNQILAAFTGFPAGSKALNQFSKYYDPAAIASHLMTGEGDIGTPGGVAWYVGGGPGDPRYQKMVEVLKAQITQSLPSKYWDGLLSQIGVNGFAHGVEGIITRPGLFMAGENGPESISIRPHALGDSGDSGGGGLTINGGIHVHANDAQGGRDAADAIFAELTRRMSRKGIFSV